MIDVLLAPLAKPICRSTSSLAPVTAQLPQALVAAQRTGLAPAGAPPATDRDDHGPARVGACPTGRGGHHIRSSGLDMMLEAARLGLNLFGWNSDWTGARLFIDGLKHERCASMGAL
ncbi:MULTISPECIES: hypothetical protein [Sphingomonadaceae]|uniref:hypothetical protein n=1 Tax=Sphingomonadales TaxID=204457 RepID=UPI00155EDBE8|nr:MULTISPECIES: hypothetical protein [Sphingomonadaceae]MBJ7377820.1 hypothetical protein [Sphingobium sp.]